MQRIMNQPAHRHTRAWASDYFARPGTVACWWDPIAADDPEFQAWYTGQLEDVLTIAQPRGKRILDAATGRGRAAIGAALAGAAVVVAADISDEMLGHAQETATRAGVGDRIEFVRADLGRPFLEEESFDVVLLLEVLLHFEHPERVLSNLVRLLTPGGLLVVTTNGANPVSRLFQPDKGGAAPASRWKLAAAAAVNEAMTAAFGFTWARTGPTAALYRHFFNAPVRPLYPRQVRALLRGAGLDLVYHRACPDQLVPREHRWAAWKRASFSPGSRAAPDAVD
jgi:2-polyprenyl-3-methyl-5-hydroxy-6-metoxy-1,4-benzoquinol methylase